MANSLINNLLAAGEKLRKDVNSLTFSEDRKWIYNPLDYAWEPYRQYLEKFCTSRKHTIFLGMNPGPWGMAQTGIPFGEIESVTRWMGIDAPVGNPEHEHPKRPVLGYNCPRSEVSGRRLWTLMAERYPDPRDFFAGHFVLNYCPLVFMEDSGKNLTPDKLTREEREPLDSACDEHLAAVIGILEPEHLVGIGKYAEKKLKGVVKSMLGKRTNGGSPVYKVSTVLHPSPASPAANRGWATAAVRQLTAAGIW